MDTSLASEETRAGGHACRVSMPPAYQRATYQLTMPRGRLSNGTRGVTLPKRLSISKKAKEVVHQDEDDGTGAGTADSSRSSDEEEEADSDTSASGSPEESGARATRGKTVDEGCKGTATPIAKTQDDREEREPELHRDDERTPVEGYVNRTGGTPLDTNFEDVRISSKVLEQLIQAQDKSAKENARLEALFLNAMSKPSGGSRRRKAQKQRDPGQGCMNPKRQLVESWSGESDDDAEDDDEDMQGSGGRHMRTAKSPILQRALEHLPTDKAWKVSGHAPVASDKN
ncbi:unnamed protein product [Closterium sp. Naga37s-1]|nr:unnamed protein product [Closterium sp. Naga37s-1]